MLKYTIVALMSVVAIFICGQAFAQDQPAMTVSGKVATVDPEGGVIDVKTDSGTMVFYISTESRLLMSFHHMSSIEIQKNDPVTIQYTVSSGQNNIISLVDNRAT